ncbi:hypothetical protein V6K52_00515 [Knoellia sp. S7-12]|uniref:hypothetical protein n=1 Tax=Knoellia sp. S7-12 TaxID=3126698 RepID=UPI00336925B4
MDGEIQLISDGDGVAVIGDPRTVELFLAAEGLESRDLGLPKLASALSVSGGAAHVGSEIAANSGRWVKLTEKSAKALKQQGTLMKGSEPGASRAVLTDKGKIKGFLEITKTPGSLLSNPALLAGAAGLMAQLAMQQTMDEITDYLALIDEKVDDVLRAQKDAALARLIGVGLVIDESMTIRAARGRVDEITWSKVQGAPATIAETQAYALRQLDALAEKLETKAKSGDFAETAKDVESKGQEWLAVLARTFHLQEAIAVLELDRVLDASPEEIDGHRLGLKAARQARLELIARTTQGLVARMDAAAGRANQRVLLNPIDSREVVQSSNRFGIALADFHGRLGIEGDRQSMEARRWAQAATDVRGKAFETGAGGLNAAKRLGGGTLDRTKTATGMLSGRFTERARRRRGDIDIPETDS